MEKNVETTTFDRWQIKEGIPVYRGYHLEDVRTLSLQFWPRLGIPAAFINLSGQESATAYVAEIPAAKRSTPQKHLYEELIYIISGRGKTEFFDKDIGKHSIEWQEGKLFSPPLNVKYQHTNLDPNVPVRFLSVTNAPFIMNLFHNDDFIFNNSFQFTDRFNWELDYFSQKGNFLTNKIFEINAVEDARSIPLVESKIRGRANRVVLLELCQNTMAPHISQFGVGSYKKGHRHGPGANIIILSGKGYSLLWKEGEEKIRVDWKVGSMFSPPSNWYHQHFNTGKDPARYLAMKPIGKKYSMGEEWQRRFNETGGEQIEYENEAPEIKRMYEEELSKEGLKMSFDPLVRNK